MSFEPAMSTRQKSKCLTDEVLRQPLESTRPPRPTVVCPGTTVGDVVRVMRRQRTAAVLICDPQSGELVGIFTERDLLRLAGSGRSLDAMPIEECMTRHPVAQSPWDSIGFALHRMIVEGYRNIPVIGLDGRPCGIVSMAHLLKYLCRFLPSVDMDEERAHRQEVGGETEQGDWREPAAIGA